MEGGEPDLLFDVGHTLLVDRIQLLVSKENLCLQAIIAYCLEVGDFSVHMAKNSCLPCTKGERGGGREEPSSSNVNIYYKQTLLKVDEMYCKNELIATLYSC